MILTVTLLLTNYAVIYFMIFIKSLLIYFVIIKIPVIFSELPADGLNIKFPAVWNLAWKPTKLSDKYNTSIIYSLSLYLITIYWSSNILTEYNICITHFCSYFLYKINNVKILYEQNKELGSFIKITFVYRRK